MWTCISNKSSIPAKEQLTKGRLTAEKNRKYTPENTFSGTYGCPVEKGTRPDTRNLLPRERKDTLKKADIQLSASGPRPIF